MYDIDVRSVGLRDEKVSGKMKDVEMTKIYLLYE